MCLSIQQIYARISHYLVQLEVPLEIIHPDRI